MTESASPPRATVRLVWLLELGLLVRVLAANLATWAAGRRGERWLFPDTDIYWLLGRAIRQGLPYEVSQWGVPHFALRAPGYPLFLAGCQAVFGDRTLPARLVQAALGAACVVIVARLVARAVPGEATDLLPGRLGRWSPALVAAALAAVEPYTVATSTVLLSEALFLPLMLLGLWGLALAWEPIGERASLQTFLLLSFAAGLAWGAAVLVKPSWALFPPLAAGAWIAFAGRGRRLRALAGALVVGLGLVAIMLPWWVRNYEVFGRFVPTALWAGASLYDGLHPGANGASDMRFLHVPPIRDLHEEAQDAALKAQALAFARQNPVRVLELAAIKAARFWSPWPNLETARSPVVAVVSALVVVPLYVLALIGAWDRRRDARALVLLAGPVLYFAAIHMVFVSSIRYRIPGFVPALGLVALGARRCLVRCPWSLGRGA